MVFSGVGGVTAEVAKGFIRYGCTTVFLLGRTPPANQMSTSIKRKAHADLIQTGVKVTPVMIQQRLMISANSKLSCKTSTT